MKRILIIFCLMFVSLSAVSCNNDRGTILDLSFSSLFKRNVSDITLFILNGTMGTINGTEINLTLPCNTATLTDLKAIFVTNPIAAVVTVNGVEQSSGNTSNNFTNPVEYTVTTKKGKIKTYTVYAVIANVDEKALTHFWLNDVEATITGTSITITLPYGTDPAHLIAKFNTTGSEVRERGVLQESGYENDFSSQLIYTVKACNGTTRDYTVDVTIALNDANDITGFSIPGSVGVYIGTDTITVTMPYGTALSSLTPTINVSPGASVSPVSGQAQNFSNSVAHPVVYTVTAENGSQKTYAVTVDDTINTANDILGFAIPGSVSVNLGANTISVVMPYGTALSSLAPTITVSPDAGISPASGEAQDFSDSVDHPIVYTVTAENGSPKTYAVTVDDELNTAKNITGFAIPGSTGVSIGTNAITVTMPYGTAISNFTPMITVSPGASVSPASGVAQNFSDSVAHPVVYTVTAENGSQKTYAVTVDDALNTANDITGFAIAGSINESMGTNTIMVTVPYGTTLSSLAPMITVSPGASVSPGSGQAQNFSNSVAHPVVYTVTAENGSQKTYAVTVDDELNTANDIIGFVIPGSSGVNIGANMITVTMPYGTTLSNLTPTITVSPGASVSPASGQAQNFSDSIANPIAYIVTAENGTQKTYAVTVDDALNAANSITGFTIPDSVGVNIGTNTITVTMPYGTTLSDLTPTITVSPGASVIPASGETQDFSDSVANPVAYTVTAENGSPKTYGVTIVNASGDDKDITAFSINGVNGTIGSNAIVLNLPYGTDKSSLVPSIIHTGKSISPESGVPVNFTGTVNYTVTALNDTQKTYAVTITANFIVPGSYAAGYYHNSMEYIACLWNIGVTTPYKTDLEATTSTVVSTVVSGDTVYVVGTYNNIPCYWKISGEEKTRINLTENSTVADSLISASGDYLYITGTNSNNACYWRVNLFNDTYQTISLTNGANSNAYEITESGGFIYMAGTTLDPMYSYETPCFWSIIADSSEEGSRVLIFNNRSNGKTVMIDGSSVVIGGWLVYSTPYTQAKTWTYIDLPVPDVNLPPDMESPYSSIVSSSLNVSGDLYFVGQQTGTACYWLNGTRYNLSGATGSCAYGIMQNENDIFMSGYHSSNTGVTSSTACVWKKSGSTVTPIPLTSSATGEAAARDVFIKN